MSRGKWRRKAGACSAHIFRTLTGLLLFPCQNRAFETRRRVFTIEFPTVEKLEVAGARSVEEGLGSITRAPHGTRRGRTVFLYCRGGGAIDVREHRLMQMLEPNDALFLAHVRKLGTCTARGGDTVGSAHGCVIDR